MNSPHTMQMMLKSFIWNEFIDEQSLLLRDAIAHQGDQMPMMDTANDFDFCPELPLALSATCLELLNCHQFSIRQPALVNASKPTLTQNILARKPACYFHHFFIAEKGLSAAYAAARIWCPSMVHIPSSLTPIATCKGRIIIAIYSTVPHCLLLVVVISIYDRKC